MRAPSAGVATTGAAGATASTVKLIVAEAADEPPLTVLAMAWTVCVEPSARAEGCCSDHGPPLPVGTVAPMLTPST